MPGESEESVLREVRETCARLAARHPGFRAASRVVFAQGPSDVAPDAPIVRALAAALEGEGEPAVIEGMSAWTDAAILNEAGIPAICFGPGDIRLAHAAEEWVEIAEIERATRVMTRLARDFRG